MIVELGETVDIFLRDHEPGHRTGTQMFVLPQTFVFIGRSSEAAEAYKWLCFMCASYKSDILNNLKTRKTRHLSLGLVYIYSSTAVTSLLAGRNMWLHLLCSFDVD